MSLIPILWGFYFLLPGVPGAVPAPARDPPSVQEGAQLHEGDTCSQVPGGLCPGEGHQGRQPVAGAEWQVSVPADEMTHFRVNKLIEMHSSHPADWWCRSIREPCTLCFPISS